MEDQPEQTDIITTSGALPAMFQFTTSPCSYRTQCEAKLLSLGLKEFISEDGGMCTASTCQLGHDDEYIPRVGSVKLDFARFPLVGGLQPTQSVVTSYLVAPLARLITIIKEGLPHNQDIIGCLNLLTAIKGLCSSPQSPSVLLEVSANKLCAVPDKPHLARMNSQDVVLRALLIEMDASLPVKMVEVVDFSAMPVVERHQQEIITAGKVEDSTLAASNQQVKKPTPSRIAQQHLRAHAFQLTEQELLAVVLDIIKELDGAMDLSAIGNTFMEILGVGFAQVANCRLREFMQKHELLPGAAPPLQSELVPKSPWTHAEPLIDEHSDGRNHRVGTIVKITGTYGFIQPDDGTQFEDNVYFKRTNPSVAGFSVGDRVQFDCEKSRSVANTLVALDVRAVSKGPNKVKASVMFATETSVGICMEGARDCTDVTLESGANLRRGDVVECEVESVHGQEVITRVKKLDPDSRIKSGCKLAHEVLESILVDILRKQPAMTPEEVGLAWLFKMNCSFRRATGRNLKDVLEDRGFLHPGSNTCRIPAFVRRRYNIAYERPTAPTIASQIPRSVVVERAISRGPVREPTTAKVTSAERPNDALTDPPAAEGAPVINEHGRHPLTPMPKSANAFQTTFDAHKRVLMPHDASIGAAVYSDVTVRRLHPGPATDENAAQDVFKMRPPKAPVSMSLFSQPMLFNLPGHH